MVTVTFVSQSPELDLMLWAGSREVTVTTEMTTAVLDRGKLGSPEAWSALTTPSLGPMLGHHGVWWGKSSV